MWGSVKEGAVRLNIFTSVDSQSKFPNDQVIAFLVGGQMETQATADRDHFSIFPQHVGVYFL